MTIPVLICDDSGMARKNMARALPPEFTGDVSFATNGREAVELLKQGKGDLLFLDLTMPVMDGYEVLEQIRKQDLPTMVIVVSGDIQPEAHERVMNLGAMDFVQKPVKPENIKGILERYGIAGDEEGESKTLDFEVDLRDCYQEIANVAMGRAGDLLARFLNAFVVLSIPNVNIIEVGELRMALNQVADNDTISAVCQGFIGSGIAGEALLIFNEASFEDMAELMKFEGEVDEDAQLELLMDVANILISACLLGIADQLDIDFSQGHPMVLDRHIRVGDLVRHNANRWKATLTIEIGYTIENRQINCDLLLLFTEDSIDALNGRVSMINA